LAQVGGIGGFFVLLVEGLELGEAADVAAGEEVADLRTDLKVFVQGRIDTGVVAGGVDGGEGGKQGLTDAELVAAGVVRGGRRRSLRACGDAHRKAEQGDGEKLQPNQTLSLA